MNVNFNAVDQLLISYVVVMYQRKDRSSVGQSLGLADLIKSVIQLGWNYFTMAALNSVYA